MISSELVANVAGSPSLPSGLDQLVHVALVGGGEHVGRSASSTICGDEVRRGGEVERDVDVRVLAASNASPISSNASVSEAAANTVMSPDGGCAGTLPAAQRTTARPIDSSNVAACHSGRIVSKSMFRTSVADYVTSSR